MGIPRFYCFKCGKLCFYTQNGNYVCKGCYKKGKRTPDTGVIAEIKSFIKELKKLNSNKKRKVKRKKIKRKK